MHGAGFKSGPFAMLWPGPDPGFFFVGRDIVRRRGRGGSAGRWLVTWLTPSIARKGLNGRCG